MLRGWGFAPFFPCITKQVSQSFSELSRNINAVLHASEPRQLRFSQSHWGRHLLENLKGIEVQTVKTNAFLLSLIARPRFAHSRNMSRYRCVFLTEPPSPCQENGYRRKSLAWVLSFKARECLSIQNRIQEPDPVHYLEKQFLWNRLAFRDIGQFSCEQAQSRARSPLRFPSYSRTRRTVASLPGASCTSVDAVRSFIATVTRCVP